MIVEKRRFPARSVLLLLVLGLFLFSSILYPCQASETETSESQAQEAPGPSYTQEAAFIAGMHTAPWGPFAKYESEPAWKQFAGFFDQAWENYDRRQLQPMSKWAATELSAPISSRLSVFYPLSGPDFVDVYTLFPRARTYILIALQPIGEVPDFQAMSPEEFNGFFSGLKQSLHDLLLIHYFITSHMKATLEGGEVDGVLPVLMFFLGREKAHILDIQRWYMKWDGTIEQVSAFGEGEPAPADSIGGVRIVFQREDSSGLPQTLYYFNWNLFNSSFTWNRHFMTFLQIFGPLITFIKSGSYVLFDPRFSAARRFILDQSRYVLQDDSGIPFKDFDPSVWDFKFYGVYKGPIAVFKQDYQPDLAQAYRADKEVGPLPFGIGYHYEANTSNLFLAIKQ